MLSMKVVYLIETKRLIPNLTNLDAFNAFWIFEYDIRYNVDNAHLNSGTSIFGFSTLDYIVWTHFQENNFGAVPSFPVMLHFCIEWPICRRQKMIFRRQSDARMTCLPIFCVFVQKKRISIFDSRIPTSTSKDDSPPLLIFAKKYLGLVEPNSSGDHSHTSGHPFSAVNLTTTCAVS